MPGNNHYIHNHEILWRIQIHSLCYFRLFPDGQVHLPREQEVSHPNNDGIYRECWGSELGLGFDETAVPGIFYQPDVSRYE